MNLESLYFPVEKIENPEIERGIELPSGLQYAVQVTKPDGTKRIVNYCSEIYHLVPNETILPLFHNEISRFYDVDVKVKMADYSRFFVDFIIKQNPVEIMRGDKLNARLRIFNSYDGSMRYQFSAAFWRQVCGNGMMGWKNMSRILKMHTPSIGEETSFAKVFEMTSKFLAEAAENTEVYKELADTTVKYPQSRVEDVIDSTSFPSSLEEDVLYRLEEEKNALKLTEVTDWLIYNAFNYQLNHNDEIKTKENKRERMDQEVLEYLRLY